MSGDRRAFLRSLAALPLIGGGVTLIGQPTAVAEPVTTDTLYAYTAFLAWEHAAAYWALETARHGSLPLHVERIIDPHDRASAAPMFWLPAHRGVAELLSVAGPASRAALVMSAAGLDWRRVAR